MKAQMIIARVEACGQLARRLMSRIGNTLGPIGPGELEEVATSLCRGLAMAEPAMVSAVGEDATQMRCAHVDISIGTESATIGRREIPFSPEARAMVEAIRQATQCRNPRLTTHIVQSKGAEGRDLALDGINQAASFLESCGYPRRAEAAALAAAWQAA